MSRYDTRGAFGSSSPSKPARRSHQRRQPAERQNPPVQYSAAPERRDYRRRDDRDRDYRRDDRRRGDYRRDDRRGYDDRRGDYRRSERSRGCRDSRESYRRSRDTFNRGGARHLARIHGTEDDRVNCPFFFKIGACRHGDRCGRLHTRPAFSQTVLIPHMYTNPKAGLGGGQPLQDEKKIKKEFEEFYEEIFDEFAKFGYVEDVHVCDNLGEHMIGNVYVKYRNEEDADKCVKGLNGKFYAGKPLIPEFSPVTDFHEARCRQFDELSCSRKGLCNFMHCIRISRSLKRELIEDQSEPEEESSSESSSSSEEEDRESSRRHRRRRSRSRSKERSDKKHDENAEAETR